MQRATMRGMAVAACAALALAMAACSSSQSGSKSSGNHTLAAAWSSLPDSIDPGDYQGRTTVMLSSQFMGRLVAFDKSKAQDGKVVTAQDIKPELAESYSVSSDGKSVDFQLRHGVKSATGNELTTADVQWSIERALAVDSVTQDLYTIANLDTKNPITVESKYEFQIHLNSTDALALGVWVWGGAGIYDSTEVKKHITSADPWAKDWLATHSASFGPYAVKAFTPGQSITLEANKNYWGQKPYYTSVLIKAVPDASSRIQLLTSNQVQFVTDVPTNAVTDLKTRQGVTVDVSPGSNRDLLSLNERDKHFQDPRVRLAISTALDRNAMLQSAYSGIGTPAVDCISSSISHPTPDNVLPAAGDVANAKQLLAQAGYPNGFAFTLSFSNSRPGPYAADLGRLIKSQLAAIGVTVNLSQASSISQFQDEVGKHSLAAWLYNEQPALADAGYAFYLNNYSKAFGNNQGYANPTFDQLVLSTLHTAAGSERDSLIQQACQIANREQPLVYLMETRYITALSSKIQGYYHYPTDAPAFAEWSAKS